VQYSLFVGGGDTKEQLRALRDGVHIAIGTPGKMMDLIESRKARQCPWFPEHHRSTVSTVTCMVRALHRTR
jgi:hypothetical protein